MIESIIFAAEHARGCRVLNGSRAFRVEMNKCLANFHIQGDNFRSRCASVVMDSTARLRVPPGAMVTRPSLKVVSAAAAKHSITGRAFLKGIVGGGSTSVARLDFGRRAAVPLKRQMEDANRAMQEAGASGDVFILQGSAPSTLEGVQYRFELIGGRFHYAVRIALQPDGGPSSRVDNLCMCDIEADDPRARLSVLSTPRQLAAEPGLGSLAAAQSLLCALEMFARDFDLHVVAVEGTLHGGFMYAFDVNTNSNYNAKLEAQYGVKPAAWQVLDSALDLL